LREEKGSLHSFCVLHNNILSTCASWQVAKQQHSRARTKKNGAKGHAKEAKISRSIRVCSALVDPEARSKLDRSIDHSAFCVLYSGCYFYYLEHV